MAILNCDENVHCTWLNGDVFWPPQDNSSTVASGRVILVDIFKGRRWPRTGQPARMAHGAWRMAHGTWHMEKALSAPLTGRRPGRAKAVRVVRQLVWVEDRVTSGRGHLQQLATRCRSYGFPQTCRRRFDQKGGKGAPVGVRFRRIVSVGVLKMCQFELTSNSSEGGHDVSEGDEARGSVGGCA